VSALGEEQMEWLEKVLEDATAKEQRVVICTHVPLCPHDQTAYAVIWNYEEARSLTAFAHAHARHAHNAPRTRTHIC
jgi:phosphodiesterase/alkaline phosphatase D-like protein